MDPKITLFHQMISDSRKIAIIGHNNPDGDSVGSVTAFRAYLSELGKANFPVLPSVYPQFLNFLNEDGRTAIYSDDHENAESEISGCDMMVCIDFNSPDRTDVMAELITGFPGKKVLIDHHPNPDTESFDLVFSDLRMSSACEYLFWILYSFPEISENISNMNFECAQALGTGMITDTNNFNNSVIPSTFEMASLLLKRGVALDEINRKVFSGFTSARMKLMGHMLSEEMVVDEELGAAYMILSLQTQNRFGYQTGDSEGFVNLPLNIKNVEVSALFTENQDNIRVSLRSKGKISVNKLSHLYFGGGGHERAAGGKLEIPVSQIPEYFTDSLKKFLKDQ